MQNTFYSIFSAKIFVINLFNRFKMMSQKNFKLKFSLLFLEMFPYFSQSKPGDRNLNSYEFLRKSPKNSPKLHRLLKIKNSFASKTFISKKKNSHHHKEQKRQFIEFNFQRKKLNETKENLSNIVQSNNERKKLSKIIQKN